MNNLSYLRFLALQLLMHIHWYNNASCDKQKAFYYGCISSFVYNFAVYLDMSTDSGIGFDVYDMIFSNVESLMEEPYDIYL